ncbi:MAG: NAD(P)/FAD-dependent oxidoreductase [Myxococcales bacterium]|nr:NAD(P)/FAD-dependent oxidoreductase [Myxococcales bacterium]
MAQAETKHVVIIGGGFGGLQCARALARAPVQVTVVDRENHHLFQPLLYQVATAGLAPGSIAVPVRSVVGAHANTRVLMGEVTEVDLEARTLCVAGGDQLAYDYLVVAAGARTNYFGNDAWARHAYGLKSLRDAIRIRERVLLAFETAERERDPARRRELLTFVVIGGGPTGVEMAGAISELGRRTLARDFHTLSPADVRVVLVEMGERLLAPFDPELSYCALEQLEALDVEVRLGQRVTDVNPRGARIEDEEVHASVVVWASGVKAASLAERLGVTLDRQGRIRVDTGCAVLGRSDVFAIGDIACHIPEGETQALPGLAPVAIQQGRHVAKQIARELRRKPRKPFRYVDKGIMATIGRNRAVAQTSLPALGKLHLSGLLAWLSWLFIHILYLIGFRNRFIVLFNWVWSYLTYGRGARLITAYVAGERAEPEVGPGPLDITAAFAADPPDDDAAQEPAADGAGASPRVRAP